MSQPGIDSLSRPSKQMQTPCWQAARLVSSELALAAAGAALLWHRLHNLLVDASFSAARRDPRRLL